MPKNLLFSSLRCNVLRNSMKNSFRFNSKLLVAWPRLSWHAVVNRYSRILLSWYITHSREVYDLSIADTRWKQSTLNFIQSNQNEKQMTVNELWNDVVFFSVWVELNLCGEVKKIFPTYWENWESINPKRRLVIIMQSRKPRE